MSFEISGPHHDLRALDLSTTSPPSKRSPSISAHSRTLSLPPQSRPFTSLPVDILLRIAEHLSPPLATTSSSPSNGPSHSSTWISPLTDAINLSSTCHFLWTATRIVVQRQFGIVVRELDWDGGNESKAVQELHRIVSRLQRIRPSEEGDTEATVPPQRIRDFFVHLSVPSTDEAVESLDACLAHTIDSLPRLESFSLVLLSEEQISEDSPFETAVLGPALLTSLSRSSTLSQLLLCGIKLRRDTPVPTFGPRLTELLLAGAHDSLLAILRKAPALRDIKIWREYTRAPTIIPEVWWGEETWATVTDLELAGFGSPSARRLLDTWRKTLVSLRTTRSIIPLRSLCLPEPHPRETLLEILALLPHLTSLTILLWRDRAFAPSLLGELATLVPDLEELGIGVEDEELHRWPGNLRQWARYLGEFNRLRTLTWNHTPYMDTSFDDVRDQLRSLATLVASSSPQLRKIRWFGVDACLGRKEEGEAWKWDDEARREEWRWWRAEDSEEEEGRRCWSVEV